MLLRRWAGLGWAAVLCPPIGWLIAVGAQPIWLPLMLLLSIGVPALLAAAGNAALGRGRRASAIAAGLAAVVVAAGLVLFLIVVLLTVSDDFV